ncbi:glucosyltransferase domain-containing protein [Dongia deserti]|uniref:glucosyltransferase domain-containing protein n=1 Tax=Dongia deserti TaxID=2268030 RepID=UPI000E650E8C|nr:glucosyltransferase domain-containing protein [Dongia deserti]
MTLHGSRVNVFLAHLSDFRNFQRPFIILLAIFSTFYFLQLVGFSLSIDDEVAALREDPAPWVGQGRWLIYVLERFILSQPVLPFFTLFTFGVLVSASYIVLGKAHSYRTDSAPLFLLFALFAAFPTLYFILNFAANTVGLGIGILLACMCVLLFDRAVAALLAGERLRSEAAGRFLLQAGLGTAAIGAYQSLILLVAVGCCGVFILRYLRSPGISWRQVAVIHAYLAFVILASVLLGLLLARGFQMALGVAPIYIENFLRPDALLHGPGAVFGKLVKQYWQVYGGKRSVYGFRYWTFPALILLGVFALTARVPDRTAARLVFTFLYLMGMTAIPFGLNIVAGGTVPYRTLVAVPYVFWFLAAGAVLSDSAAVRRIAVILVVIVAAQCLYTFSAFQASRRLAFEHDVQLASRIYERIATEIPNFDRTKVYRADFYGALGFDSIYRDALHSTISASFFEWDGGNPHRIASILKILGYSNIVALDEKRRRALLPVIQQMPIWPANGSVRVVDDVVLVRLGQQPGTVHRKLLAAGD